MVGIRIPNDPIAKYLLDNIDTYLVAPSANRSNNVSPTSSNHVMDDFPTHKLIVLERAFDSPMYKGIESTIIQIDCKDKKIYIMRHGMMPLKEFVPLIDKYGFEIIDFFRVE